MRWKTVKIGDVVFLDQVIVAPSSPEAIRLPYLGLEQIESQTGRILSYNSNIDEAKSTTFAFNTNHVLYGKLRPYLNKVAIPEKDGRCSTEIIPLYPKGVDRQFLGLLLRCDDVVSAVMSKKTGSRMPRADMDVLMEFEVSIPELVEDQRRIAARLKAQLAEVGKALKAVKKQQEEHTKFVEAIFRENFQGVTPVSVLPSLTEPPNYWSWHKLNEAARLESGHTPSRQRPDWWNGDVSWISLTEIRQLDGKWTNETILKTNEEGIANSAARILPSGTVCYSRTASVGFVTIMGSPMATSQDFANWVCGEKLDPEFLMYALICARKELRELATGATHKTIYMPRLKNFHVCAPNIEKQQKIVRSLKQQLSEIESLSIALSKEMTDITALPNRLLVQAFEMN
ncbi:MAG: restriction endonuclease subunit S [Pseudomonadota bacterium]